MKKNVPPEQLCTAWREAVKLGIRKYGLTDYNISFAVSRLPDADAQVRYHVGEKRSAQFYIDENVPLTRVPALAEHECLELLLGEIAEMASHQFSDEVVNRELHKIIYAITNAEEGTK
jgi:hypothetical protein